MLSSIRIFFSGIEEKVNDLESFRDRTYVCNDRGQDKRRDRQRKNE